jgi:glycosyltransferase involved in cell wall biosynthesis
VSVEGGTFRLVSVGPLTWERGYAYALLALRRLLDEAPGSATYRIFGEGPELRHLLFTIADLELDGHAAVRAAPTRRRLPAALAQADAYLDLSVRPAPGGALRVALALGVPVVVTAEAAGGELAHGGAVAPVRDPEAAARALARLRDRSLQPAPATAGDAG